MSAKNAEKMSSATFAKIERIAELLAVGPLGGVIDELENTGDAEAWARKVWLMAEAFVAEGDRRWRQDVDDGGPAKN